MTQWIVNVLGVTVLVAGGLGAVGLVLGLACNYFWRKLQDAYSLSEVIRVVQQHGQKIQGPMDVSAADVARAMKRGERFKVEKPEAKP